jgi:hypothetical protein
MGSKVDTSYQTSGSVKLDQLLGHLVRLISPHWTTFYGIILKLVCSSKPRSLDELKARITNAIHEQQLRDVFNEL